MFFCENHNAVVFCDHTSSYKGRFRQIDALLTVKKASCLRNIRLLIHLGEVSGDHFNMGSHAQEVWRISKDGQLRDRYGKLSYMFQMSELHFLRGMQIWLHELRILFGGIVKRNIRNYMLHYRNFLFQIYGWLNN